MPSGVELIAAERQRQVDAEGWTPTHDRGHKDAQLARAAAVYAAPEPIFVKRDGKDGTTFRTPWPRTYVSNLAGRGEGLHPWRKPECDRVTELVRAGALIAAEIDRLQRAAHPHDQEAPQTENHPVCEECGAPVDPGFTACVDCLLPPVELNSRLERMIEEGSPTEDETKIEALQGEVRMLRDALGDGKERLEKRLGLAVENRERADAERDAAFAKLKAVGDRLSEEDVLDEAEDAYKSSPVGGRRALEAAFRAALEIADGV